MDSISNRFGFEYIWIYWDSRFDNVRYKSEVIRHGRDLNLYSNIYLYVNLTFDFYRFFFLFHMYVVLIIYRSRGNIIGYSLFLFFPSHLPSFIPVDVQYSLSFSLLYKCMLYTEWGILRDVTIPIPSIPIPIGISRYW